jgi:monofunctional biosynthetic peptidoglycan transglycosylase
MRGASTITQQLARNLYLSPSRNPLRKLKEAAIAWRLEWALSKERILELYLNIVELGPNLWGVEEASRHYFRRSASQVSIEQAALLIATLPHPLTSNPGYRPGRALRRQQLILRRLRGENVVVPKVEEVDTLPQMLPAAPPLESLVLPLPPPPSPTPLPPGSLPRSPDSIQDSQSISLRGITRHR